MAYQNINAYKNQEEKTFENIIEEELEQTLTTS